MAAAAALSVAALAWHGPARPMPTHRACATCMTIPPDVKVKLAKSGLAIPGMEDVARKAAATAPSCTPNAPCDMDASFISSLALASLGVVAIVLLAGISGAAADEDDFLEALERRAERSRSRRDAQLRGLAKAVKPLQDSPLGWELVDDEGMPTSDAFVFLTLAVASQAWLASWLWQAGG